MVNSTKKQNQSNKFYKLKADAKKYNAAFDSEAEVEQPIRMTTKTFRKAPLRQIADMRKAIKNVQKAQANEVAKTNLKSNVMEQFYYIQRNKYVEKKFNRIKEASQY